MKAACTEARFLHDVREHALTVVRDDHLHRHLHLSRPDTCNLSFDIVTWPGYLCICGDMHSFVFARLPDMFEFFRSDNGRINPGYWAEKVQAEDKTGGVEEFSHEKFKEAVMANLHEQLEDGASNKLREDLLEMLEETEGESEETCYHHAMELLGWDFCEHRCREYTYHFIWCCYAIVWAIQQYDKLKKGNNEDQKSEACAADAGARPAAV